jgi:hypothetical protein
MSNVENRDPDGVIDAFQKKLSLYTDGQMMVLPNGFPVISKMNEYDLHLDYQGSNSVLMSCGNKWELRLPSEKGTDTLKSIVELLKTSSTYDQVTIEKDAAMLVQTLHLSDDYFGDILSSIHPVYVYITGSDYYSTLKTISTNNHTPSIKEVPITYQSSIRIYIRDGMEQYGPMSSNLLSKWISKYTQESARGVVNFWVREFFYSSRDQPDGSLLRKELDNIGRAIDITFKSNDRESLKNTLSYLSDLIRVLPGLYFQVQ